MNQLLSLQEFCRLLKTVKVDVDSSGKKCKERMMKVLIETPLSSSCGRGYESKTCDYNISDIWNLWDLRVSVELLQSVSLFLPVSVQGFVVKNYQSLPELTAAFQEFHLTELYQQMLPSLSDAQHAGSHGD